ncbi:CDP-glycerol glycerophosphotransferase family protein [Vibrio splendidus]|uniref:CDP-glycerol glycerophosphotransferase family protein n=1 Tax=Vibrio splendidus TaxID=29497 RepID=UPI00080DE858|nr:CDP-glycerol glycerophosphotransferase family protein [Vibrio splendidus]OCH61147.1 hypothetical protein A6D94_18315 [Vibrio splendidus]
MLKKYLYLIFQILIDIMHFLLGMIYKRKVILVGSHFGFKGEAKHIYIQLTHLSLNEKVFWVYKHHRPTGISGYSIKINSIKYWFYVIVSDSVVFSHRLADVCYVKPSQCISINVWHGEPIKKIGYNSLIESHWIDHQKALYSKTEYDNWNYLLVYNERYRKKLLSATRMEPSKVVTIRSQMHTDLGGRRFGGHAQRSEKRILFAPTFRSYDYNFSFLESNDLHDFLCKKNVYLDIKFHPMYPLDNIDLSGCKWMNLLDTSVDINEIYSDYDLLVTDYSSCVFDAEALGLLSILYVPDFDLYSESVGGLYDDLSDFKSSLMVCHTSEEMISSLELVLFDRALFNKEIKKHSIELNISDLSSVDFIFSKVRNEAF